MAESFQLIVGTPAFLCGTVRLQQATPLRLYSEFCVRDLPVKQTVDRSSEKAFFRWECDGPGCDERTLRKYFDENVRPRLDERKLSYDIVSFGPTDSDR